MKNISTSDITRLVKENWQAGLTVAMISIPLSIALSIASGAGPLPGIITGIVATLVAGIFGGNHFNIVGAAGALATILFAATLAAPGGLGASVLPFIALVTGFIILAVWFFKLDRFLYYIPSSVMYGFAAGVALLIAASQLFDATGLSHLTRTGHLTGDIEKFIENIGEVHLASVLVFAIFLGLILLFKKFVKKIPAVIPAAIFGIIFGYLTSGTDLGITTLADKFGTFTATLILPVSWEALALFKDSSALIWILQVSGVVALVAILETLITAKLADKLTRRDSSSSRELLGLSLANMASGLAGGLPATGVFIRTGANIKAGATHRTSAILTAVFTALIALLVLPLFTYLPMAVIAAILVNTALGLLEIHKFKEFFAREKESFFIAILVAIITIFHDAGLGVTIGAVVALILFAQKISRGRFDVIWNFTDGKKEDVRGERHISLPEEKKVKVATYSVAGNMGYIDAERHRLNLKKMANSDQIENVIIRLRDLFSIDIEGVDALDEAVQELKKKGKGVYFSSVSKSILDELLIVPTFIELSEKHRFNRKTVDILKELGVEANNAQ